tara:strand:- start:41 stop:643 length:603 start_codon:yes stop_codon:yes gene_type:complete
MNLNSVEDINKAYIDNIYDEKILPEGTKDSDYINSSDSIVPGILYDTDKYTFDKTPYMYTSDYSPIKGESDVLIHNPEDVKYRELQIVRQKKEPGTAEDILIPEPGKKKVVKNNTNTMNNKAAVNKDAVNRDAVNKAANNDNYDLKNIKNDLNKAVKTTKINMLELLKSFIDSLNLEVNFTKYLSIYVLFILFCLILVFL